jgi:hypothetical protein
MIAIGESAGEVHEIQVHVAIVNSEVIEAFGGKEPGLRIDAPDLRSGASGVVRPGRPRWMHLAGVEYVSARMDHDDIGILH